MFDTLTKKITEILEPLYTDAGGYGENPYVKEVIDAVRHYNKKVIEKDDKPTPYNQLGLTITNMVKSMNQARNNLRIEISKRQEDLL